MRFTPETVMAIASKIVELKRQLSEAQVQWDSIFPEDVHPRVPAVVPVAATTAVVFFKVRGNSATGRVLAAINQSPTMDFEPTRVSQDMAIPLATTRTILSKLVKKGLIEKRGAAKYGALTAREKEVPPEEKTS